MKKITTLLIYAFLMVMSPFNSMAINTSDFVIDEGTLIGDVNGDNLVSSVDVTVLYNYLLNNNSNGIVNGDQDGDGIITSADIMIVYNILLNGGGGNIGSTTTMQAPQWRTQQAP